MMIVLFLLHTAAALTLNSFGNGDIHSHNINLQIQQNSCSTLGEKKNSICYNIKSIEIPSRSKPLSLCFHEDQITEPKFLSAGNMGNGSYMYEVIACNHSIAKAWQQTMTSGTLQNRFDPALRPSVSSDCMASGTFRLITTCADKVIDLKSKASGMTNDIQTPPIQNPRCMEEWQDTPSLYSMMNVLSAARSTFGQPYGQSAFGHGDKMFVEFIMQRHSSFKRMVEFGTWTGITTMYFGMTAALRSGTLTSFDIADQRTVEVKKSWLNSSSFILADLEDPKNINAKAANAVKQADFLFNDGWNKDVESALYAKYLKVGAGLLEHDFSYDHERKQAGYFLEQLGFEAKYESIAKHFNSCARFWIRTSVPKDAMKIYVHGMSIDIEEEEEIVEKEKGMVGTVQFIKGVLLMEKEVVLDEEKEEKELEEISFVQYAMQFEEGRDLLARWRQQ